jgi:hypothetical protein
MKFTTAAAVLASTTTVTALDNDANRALSMMDFSSKGDRSEISSLLQERLAGKNKGKVLRNLQSKAGRSQLRNLGEEEELEAPSDVIDVGLFSRHLQSNITEPEEGLSIMEQILMVCADDSDPTFDCVCSNVDIDLYTASVSCTYIESCLDPTPNACGDTVTFCYEKIYNLEVSGAGIGSSETCYNVNSPETFQYCFGSQYTIPDSTFPTGCSLQLDGEQCSCAIYRNENNVTCSNFDCSNIDDVVGAGTICGDETVVQLKIEDYLIYAPLPCDNGCKICPGNGDMNELYNEVTLISGDAFACWELNLAAQSGYFAGLPGDLCSALPELVAEPCECTPVPTEAPMIAVTDGEGEDVSETLTGDEASEPPASAAARTWASGMSLGAAAMATTFAWIMA